MSLTDIVLDHIDSFQNGVKRHWMEVGRRYYRTEHDILHTQRTAIGEHGEKIIAPNVADNRLAHGFLRELVEQKTQYLFGKPFSLQVEPFEAESELQEVFDERFTNLLRSTAKDAINLGVGWISPHYDKHGRFTLRQYRAEEMIPIWQDARHTELEGMIRLYEVERFENRNKRIEKHVELWTERGWQRFKLEGRNLKPIIVRHPHGYLETNDGIIGFNWQRVPFVAFRYNDEEMPLIRSIKTLIDDYDRVASGHSNALEDQPNSILVVKNYDGQKLGDFRRNLSAYRAVKVTDDGGVEALQTPLDSEAASVHLDRLRRDIYAFGRGLDMRSGRSWSNISGVALKQEYAGLDMDCNGLETQFQESLSQLLWFVKSHFCRMKASSEPRKWKVEFTFNRDIITNEQAAIEMCRDSEGIISKETIVANHPWTKSVDKELQRLSLSNNVSLS